MGQLSVRDELFLLAHDDDGRALVAESHLSSGLAGATLVGLLLDSAVAVFGGRLEVLDAKPTGDDETDATVAAIAANTAPCGPRAWVSWISHGAYERVAEAMERDGLIRRSHQRRLGLVPVTRCVAGNPDDLVRIRSRLRYAVMARELPEPATAALCALVRVLRLEAALLLSMSTADLLLGLERVAEANDVTVRQVTSAVETVITSGIFS
jgi:Golgi phosphoprotein 3 (GPP34)